MNSFPAWIQRIETFEIPNCVMVTFFWPFWCCEYFLTRTPTVFSRPHSTEKTRTIYAHGEAKFLWASFRTIVCKALVIDKCPQVSHKPSSFLFGMLDTKEGKNVVTVDFCSSGLGLWWLGRSVGVVSFGITEVCFALMVFLELKDVS